MNDSVKLCAIGVICAVLCVMVRHYRAEFVIPSRISAILLIFGALMLMLSPLMQYLKNIMGEAMPTEYMELVLKALGIAYMTQISSELCRDCGEGNIASCIDTVGKIEIILISLPLLSEIIDMSKELMVW